MASERNRSVQEYKQRIREKRQQEGRGRKEAKEEEKTKAKSWEVVSLQNPDLS